MNHKQTIARATMREYWRHATKYKFLSLGVFFTVPLALLFNGILPQLFVSKVLGRVSDGSFTHGDLWGSFGWLILGYAGSAVLGGIILWRLAIIFIWSLEMRVIRDMYDRMFSHLVSQSMNFHSDRFGGALVSQANKFTSAYIRLADALFFNILTLLSWFSFTFIILYPRAPLVAFALLALSIVFILIAVWATKAVRHLRVAEADAENKQTAHLADAVTNVQSIKSFASEDFESKRFGKVTNSVKAATQAVMIASVKRETLFGFSTVTINTVAITGALIGVTYYNADVATVYLVIAYTAQLVERLWEFANHTLKDINRAFGDAEEMTKTLALAPSIVDAEQPEANRIGRGDIRWEAVTFTHGGAKKPIFNKLDLHIKPGEKVGLVGPSGSGKTTFTRLLMRFSDINDGQILVDGQDIRNVTQADLHSHIAYVPQEPLLFHRSIRENIAYGNLKASNKEIEAVARLSHAHEFIGNLPKGYDTLVGERGVKLSGGQRQRVAIARALLKNAPILVLDEATSALDSESEVLIQDALWKLMERRSAIVIAHRLSTIQKMDRIIVLDEGKIAEQGSHKELLATNGIYAKLWAHQSGGFIED